MEDEDRRAELTLVLNASEVYGLIGGLLALQITTLIFFLNAIYPGYAHTFYSTKTGEELWRDIFYSEDSDEHKLGIFGKNRFKWESQTKS